MTSTRLILQSILHYRFAYLGALAGAVLGATVLFGALFAGDSVKKSLRDIGEKRTGHATHLVASGDRFFREALAEDLTRATPARVAPVAYARGTAGNAATRAVASQVQLIGVTAAFWQLAPQPAKIPLDDTASAVAVNEALAQRLGVSKGDTIIVRLQKPGILAGNAPIAGAESTLQSLRCTVAAIVGDESFGRFSLDSTQVAQPSVFLPISRMQETLAQPGRANLLLIDASRSNGDLARALANVVQLADYGLTLKWIERAGSFEVSSNRIFIDPELTRAVTRAVPATQPVLSYLINELRRGERFTPYSIAAGTSQAAAPFLPRDLGAREIVINEWLAEDLQARAGDDVRLRFYQAGDTGALTEQAAVFRVRSVVRLDGLAADSAWMPDFPGISDAKRQGDWKSGLPLDLERIREKDERYWDNFRGAPKAFLSLAGAREIWSTRWGNCTALRIPFDRDRAQDLTALLLGALRPEMNQLILRNFRADAQDAARSAVDFGGLFIGMSFFLIVAALGLVAMLFHLALLQRNREDALLGAVGLAGRVLLRWRLAEGLVILLLGCAFGLPLATLYTRGILRFLGTIWAGPGAGSTFAFAAQPASIVGGSLGFLLLSMLALWLAIRKQTRLALSVRLASQAEEIALPRNLRRTSLLIAIIAAVIAAGAIGLSGRGLPAEGAFYLAGFALLVAGLAICRRWLADNPSGPATFDAPFNASYLGGLNVKARRSRSLTVVGMLATAVFMVLSVASFRKQVGGDWLNRGSGTGGFAYWIETTATLNSARDGRSQGFEIFEADASGIGEVVPLRAGVGDNANCFNLNTTSQPRLLAVDATKLAARGAFKLKLAPDGQADGGWNTLRRPGASGAIPALVDETTLQWALKRKVGDVLAYADENGRSFDIRIVGTLPDSIFQGYLVVDEQHFLQRFPSHPGYSVFLVDARSETNIAPLKKRLEAATADVGGRVDLTRDVLAAFHQIENTYIAIFNVLGSLGVVLGSLGLAIVVARNLRERRGEFAVMAAIGIPRRVMAGMVFSEFGRLVLWGIVIGAVTSALAVWPNLTTLPAGPTLVLVASLLAGIVALNLVCGWIIFRWSMRDLRPSVVQAAL